jgi:RNA polymerase sigma factor (sigma-70 family)
MSMAGRGIVLRQIDRLFGEGTLTGLGDGPLLDRYLTRRDEDAFEALVDLHGPMVLGLCRRMLRDPRDIEDAFQATFLVLVRKAPEIRDPDLLSSWLYGVAYRVARRARDRTLRRRDREATVRELEVAEDPEPTDRADVAPMLDQELSRLPERYRAPLVLCYLRGRTHDQAAEDLRCPVGTVRSRLARGRELLRKRLTRRGFAPTVVGGFLGGDATLPARLLVATVPPPLTAATVRGAVGFGSSSIIKAGVAAASAVALARGVLTTMKLAQLKWIGLAALATTLSTGGVIAVGVAAEGQKSAENPPPASTTEARLKALEDKIDRLMNRLGVPTGPEVVTEAVVEPKPAAAVAAKNMEGFIRSQDQSGTRNQPPRSGQAPPPTTNPIGELAVQLQLAIDEYNRIDNLFHRGSVSTGEREQFRGRVLIVAAQLEEVYSDAEDELQRLELERLRKEAEREKADAKQASVAAVVARNRRLNARKADMVPEDAVAKAEAELKAAMADSEIAKVEVREVVLRIEQLKRKQARIMEATKLAERIKKDVLRSAPARPVDGNRP